MNPTHVYAPRPTRQQGSILIISLIILLVLTMLGVSSMSTSTMEERMSGNSRDQSRAFQAAEVGLRRAEAFIDTIASTEAFGQNTGLYAQGEPPDIGAEETWSDLNSIQLPDGSVAGVTSQPRYVIEHMATQGQDDINIGGYGESSGMAAIDTYRVTVRATGGSDDAVVILQSYYR